MILKCLFCGHAALHVKIHLYFLFRSVCTESFDDDPWQVLLYFSFVCFFIDSSTDLYSVSRPVCGAPLSKTQTYTDTYANTLSLLLVVELPWATPWWQAIFEVALSRASSCKLYKKKKKKNKEEKEEKYQPVIYWSLSQFLSYLLKACLARYKLVETSHALLSFFFLMKTITSFLWS